MSAPAETRATAGIVLAAGASRRMGTNKLLLQFQGEPLVRRAVRTALAAGLDPLIVVLGHEADRVRAALQGLACEWAFNPVAGGPMSASLHAGIERLPAQARSVIVMLADMVQVTNAMLRRMVAEAEGNPAPLVVSRYADTLAPPTLFKWCLFDELRAATGEGAGRSVVRRHLSGARILDWPAGLMADVDTPEDYGPIN